jgi:hypothetical protein
VLHAFRGTKFSLKPTGKSILVMQALAASSQVRLHGQNFTSLSFGIVADRCKIFGCEAQFLTAHWTMRLTPKALIMFNHDRMHMLDTQRHRSRNLNASVRIAIFSGILFLAHFRNALVGDRMNSSGITTLHWPHPAAKERKAKNNRAAKKCDRHFTA